MVQIPTEDYRRLLQQLLTAQSHPDNRAAQFQGKAALRTLWEYLGEELPESRGRTDDTKGD